MDAEITVAKDVINPAAKLLNLCSSNGLAFKIIDCLPTLFNWGAVANVRLFGLQFFTYVRVQRFVESANVPHCAGLIECILGCPSSSSIFCNASLSCCPKP